MEIHKKILPGFYEQLASGEKTYELRIPDTDIEGLQAGDVLVLDEWTSLDHATRKPTGRSLKKTIAGVSHMTLGDIAKYASREDLEKKGIIIFSLKD